MQLERKHLTSLNLTLLLVHDFLFGGGIQAGDGPIKQAVKRHKTRLQAELVRLKVAKGTTKNEDLAVQTDEQAGVLDHCLGLRYPIFKFSCYSSICEGERKPMEHEGSSETL